MQPIEGATNNCGIFVIFMRSSIENSKSINIISDEKAVVAAAA